MADIKQIQNGGHMTLRQQIALTASLSAPAIIAQLSTILMQYIDASMVGRLGASESASVGLMNSSLWLFWGVCSMVTMGFSVQVAHRLGARDGSGARAVLRQGIVACAVAGALVAAIGVAVAPFLPRWLGGDESIAGGATVYFVTFVAALPILTMNYLAGGVLRAAGNMKVPGLLNVCMCILDVVFNFFLIFPAREMDIAGVSVWVPGAGLGIRGAAIGTVAAECVIAAVMMYWLVRRQPDMCLRGEEARKSYVPTRTVLSRAVRIGSPMAVGHAIIGEAATTLCGQSYGAGRYDLVKRFAWLTTILGMAVMTVMAVIMFFCARPMMDVMTPVAAIAERGAGILRIEAFAEPMYAASIVAYGAFVGVGDTLLPAVMNFGSIWLVRIPLAALMAPTMGLRGVWIAMCIELVFRGLIFLWRLVSGRWLKSGRKLQPVAPEGEGWLDQG